VPYAPNIHVAVYHVLDHVISANIAPPGAKATIHSIIDDLRAGSAPGYMIEHAEGISIQLHHLECAVAQSDANRASEARHELRVIAAAWLDMRIRH
jgi:hypothetical protein